MTEPVSKKTGTYYRRERARKSELEKDVVNKMKPLKSFFKVPATNLDNDSLRNEQVELGSEAKSSENITQIDMNLKADLNQNLSGTAFL